MLVRGPVARAARPSLIGTAARTAVVAGTATAVAGNVSRRQSQRATQAAEAQAYEQQQAAAAAAPPPPPPAAPAAAPSADIGELERLAQMHGQGLLSDEEFAAAKARLLGL